MIINDSKNLQTSNLSKFKIDSSNFKAYMALSNTLYSDKLLAIVRELVSNAIDASINAKTEKPVLVHYETINNEDYFFVQDFGTGITLDSFFNIYSNYMNSDKTSDVNANGGFGIGGKTPFIYTDNFYIDTTDPETNTRHTFDIHYDEKMIPSIHYNEDNDIQNSDIKGTKVYFKIKKYSDYNNLLKCFDKYQLMFMRHSIDTPGLSQLDNVLKFKEELNSENCSIIGNRLLRDSNSNGYIYIRCGDVLYNVKESSFPDLYKSIEENVEINDIITETFILDKFFNNIRNGSKDKTLDLSAEHLLKSHSILLSSNISGDITLDLSRENIEITSINQDKIQKIFEDAIYKIKDKRQKILESIINNESDFNIITLYKIYFFFDISQKNNTFKNYKFNNIEKILDIIHDFYSKEAVTTTPFIFNNNKLTSILNFYNLNNNNDEDFIVEPIELNKRNEFKKISSLDYFKFVNSILWKTFNKDDTDEIRKLFKIFKLDFESYSSLYYHIDILINALLGNSISFKKIDKILISDLNTLNNKIYNYQRTNHKYEHKIFTFIENDSNPINLNEIKEVAKLIKQEKLNKSNHKLEEKENIIKLKHNTVTNINYIDLKNIKKYLILPCEIEFKNKDKLMSLLAHTFYDYKKCNVNHKNNFKSFMSTVTYFEFIVYVPNDKYNELIENKLIKKDIIDNLITYMDNFYPNYYNALKLSLNAEINERKIVSKRSKLSKLNNNRNDDIVSFISTYIDNDIDKVFDEYLNDSFSFLTNNTNKYIKETFNYDFDNEPEFIEYTKKEMNKFDSFILSYSVDIKLFFNEIKNFKFNNLKLNMEIFKEFTSPIYSRSLSKIVDGLNEIFLKFDLESGYEYPSFIKKDMKFINLSNHFIVNYYLTKQKYS